MTVQVRGEKKFGHNAANTPHIRCLVVVLLDQDNLRRAVPPGDDMAGETPLLLLPLDLLLLLDLADLILLASGNSRPFHGQRLLSEPHF